MYDLDGHLEAAYEDRYTPDYEFQDFDESDQEKWPDEEEEWDEGEPFDEEDSEEDECEGHASLAGAHMGMTVYCDGSCRVPRP